MIIDEKELEKLRHGMSHVLAKALQNIYGKKVKFAIGPAVDNGFYYDIDIAEPITIEVYGKIEDEMRKIISNNEDFVRKVITKKEALQLFSDNPYKIELIEDLPDTEEISVYYLGEDFVDLCRGPHVENTKYLRNFAFKINKTAGAYWRGNEKNKMLQRIYCYGFADSQELKAYIKMIEEALKRDHRKLGKELDLFFFDETAPGMAYWLPKGFIILNQLIEFWREEHNKRGYLEFSAPQLNSSVLWKTSGHWDHYKEDMFVLNDADGFEQALKPMNCPNSIRIYQNKLRSYKDLPLRLNDVDVIHRNEKSGQLNGLFRVRMFRQDDSHNFIRNDQIGSEIKSIVEIASYLYSIFGLEYQLTLSTRPENFMGDIKVWNEAEADLKQVLNEICGDNNYRINEGDGAFYGPKIDIKMKDCIGREWQMGTIQLDFQLPLRFDLSYIDELGNKQRPIMIHRAIFGSFERFIGIITENFAGAFPVWLAPVQVKILNITDNQLQYANNIVKRLENLGVRVELDDRNETIGKKIREASNQKIPYLFIIGDKEMEQNTVSVRQRGAGDIGSLNLEDVINTVVSDIKTKVIF